MFTQTEFYVDAPHASTEQYGVLWVFIALANAGLYGLIGALLIKLLQVAGCGNRNGS